MEWAAHLWKARSHPHEVGAVVCWGHGATGLWEVRKRRRAQSHHQTARRGPQTPGGHPCLDAGPPCRRPRSRHEWPAAAALPARPTAPDTVADQERHRGPCWAALRRVIGSQAGSGKGKALHGDAERGRETAQARGTTSARGVRHTGKRPTKRNCSQETRFLTRERPRQRELTRPRVKAGKNPHTPHG